MLVLHLYDIRRQPRAQFLVRYSGIDPGGRSRYAPRWGYGAHMTQIMLETYNLAASGYSKIDYHFIVHYSYGIVELLEDVRVLPLRAYTRP